MKKTAAPPVSPPFAENPVRDRIISAAFSAFVEKGYANTSTLEIASRAKVSKRDLYANFPSKQSILLNCIAKRIARTRLPPDLPAPRTRETLAAALAAFGETVLRELTHAHAIAMYRLAIAEAERSPEIAKALSDQRSITRAAICKLLAEALAAGVLDDGDPQQMTEQFFALLWGDLMFGRLLVLTKEPKPSEIDNRARAATEALMKLYSNQNS